VKIQCSATKVNVNSPSFERGFLWPFAQPFGVETKCPSPDLRVVG